MISLKRYHSFRLPVFAKQLYRLTALNQLPILQKKLIASENLCILGEGCNSVFLNNFNGVAVLVRLMGVRTIHDDDNEIILRVAAGESFSKLAWRASNNGWWGLENLVDIPGSMGAAPMQNIGAYGADISKTIEWVDGIDLINGGKWRLSKKECAFSYRNSIFKTMPVNRFLITAVTLKLAKKAKPLLNYPDLQVLQKAGSTLSPLIIAQTIRDIRAKKLPDPKVVGNSGSFFKNPILLQNTAKALQQQYPTIPIYPQNDGRIKISAGWLIEKSGLKGFTLGAVGVSAEHALVLIHYHQLTAKPAGNASQDLESLISTVKKRVYDRFNIQLELEPIVY